MSNGRSLLENVEGAARIGFSLLTPMLRRQRMRWGATDEEVRRPLPGDDLNPTPKWSYTHAITIQAPTSYVWPWLAQMGLRRGGMYSYQGLENLIGCKMVNHDEIVPQFQQIKAGDTLLLDDRIPGFPVAAVEEGRYLLMHGEGDPARGLAHLSWLFYLEPISTDSCRLIVRFHSDYDDSTRAKRLANGPAFMEPIFFGMERKMLLTIKELAEKRYKSQHE